MNTINKRQPHKKSNLEQEVIVAVVILYLLIMGAMLAIHHLQPAGQETKTSSTSPSHDSFSTNVPSSRAAPETPTK